MALCRGDFAAALHNLIPWIGQFRQPLFDKYVEHRIVLPFHIYAQLIATEPDRALALWWREAIEQYEPQISGWFESSHYNSMIAEMLDRNYVEYEIMKQVCRLSLFKTIVCDPEPLFIQSLKKLWGIPLELMRTILSSPYLALLVNCANTKGYSAVIDIIVTLMQCFSIRPIKNIDLIAAATTDETAIMLRRYYRGQTPSYLIILEALSASGD